MVKGCREPPYPSVLTDATMEKLSLTKFVSQESQCEVLHIYVQQIDPPAQHSPLKLLPKTFDFTTRCFVGM